MTVGSEVLERGLLHLLTLAALCDMQGETLPFSTGKCTCLIECLNPKGCHEDSKRLCNGALYAGTPPSRTYPSSTDPPKPLRPGLISARFRPDSDLKRVISGLNQVEIRSKSGPNQVQAEGSVPEGRLQYSEK